MILKVNELHEIANIAKLVIITSQILSGCIINSKKNINCKFVLVFNEITIHQNS